MFLQFLYEALTKKVGISVRTNDPDRLRAKLYEARREAGDPKLESISLVKSPLVEDELWIIRKPDGEA